MTNPQKGFNIKDFSAGHGKTVTYMYFHAMYYYE